MTNEFYFDTAQFARGLTVRFKGGGTRTLLGGFGSVPLAKFLKGGGSKSSPGEREIPGLTTEGEFAEEQTFATTERALAGEGFLPEKLQKRRRKEFLASSAESFAQARTELGGTLSRLVDPRDKKVRNFAFKQLEKSFRRSQDTIRRAEEFQKFTDRQAALETGTSQLASAQNLALDIGGSVNARIGQQNRNALSQFGIDTFSSDIASGIGAGAGSLLAAQQFANRWGVA